MKKKIFIILGVLVVSISLVLSFAFKKEYKKAIKETIIASELPGGIMAYTLNGEKTSLTYNDLISNYVLDTITCKNGTVATYSKSTKEVSLSNIHMPDYCTMNFKSTLYAKLLLDNPVKSTRSSFTDVLTSTTTGTLYTATEKNVHNTSDTTVYYYAGNTTNNWVKFGGFYWRIIRTNADGSVRMLYSGTSPSATVGYINSTSTALNDTVNNPMYVGYMYGTTGSLASNRLNTNDSTAKAVIDTWYENNLSNYTRYLSTTAVYCNDRSIGSGTYNTGSTNFYFGPYTRLNTNKTPTYDCTTQGDAFSGSNSSAKLKYPIALMTADEVAYAGGVMYTNNASAWFYLNSAGSSIMGSTYWMLLSPYRWSGDETSARSMVVGGSNYPGILDDGFVHGVRRIRPVISLKGNLIWKSGDGTSSNPYEVEELTALKLADIIKEKSTSNEDGVYNENGYRYEGSNPNNYIYMTNKSTNEKQIWKIIGVFPDGENGEEVIRVRRHYEQGRFPTGAFDLNGNLWQDSTLYTNLKNDYNTSNYSGTVKFKMYLGTSSSFESYTSSDLYNMERLLNSKGTASSYANGVTSYVGEVGLIYPSDYGYAAQASDCLRIVKPNSYGSNSTCYTKNWLYQGSSTLQWIISPEYYTKYSVITIYTDGNLTEYNDSYDYLTPGDNGAYSPVMALSSEITISGTGTVSDPYVITN